MMWERTIGPYHIFFIRGHVGRPGKRGPATGSAPVATNSRAPTDTHQPGRLPGVTAPPRRRPTDNLADAPRGLG